ncbi:hypothetical protein [Cerasicoccus maritimus]|uniref:hypothetical protein n=1 Tax=Cerasicoccus maritimus TaxID=490089 RepID=UPI0028526E70|nr:hypothetical protein [Cerasicoccus maritimus]
MTKESANPPIKMNWESLKQALPNTAQFLKLSIQRLRLEYRDKEEMQVIWEELGSLIGRRGSLRIEDAFEVGCGVNLTPHIDAAQFPTEAAQLKELYSDIQDHMKEAEANGWIEVTQFPNINLSLTGIACPTEPTQDEVKAIVALVPDNKQRHHLTSDGFKLRAPACFRFSHRRRQEKALDRKLEFVRDQAMAELENYRKNALGIQHGEPISICTDYEGQIVVTVSFFNQSQTLLELPTTHTATTFKERLAAARKQPNKYLQSCLAEGKAIQHLEATPNLHDNIDTLLEEAEIYLGVPKVEYVIILTPFVYEARLPANLPPNRG